MPYCAIINCNSKSKKDSGVSLFRLPKVNEREGPEHAELLRKRRAQWIANISRADLNEKSEHTRVCNKHFLSGKPSSNYDKNNPDWAPTLNMGHSKIRDKSSVAIARSARINKRKEMKKRVNDANILLSFHKHASSTSESESSNSEQDVMEEPPTCNETDADSEAADTDQNSCSQECQTDIAHEDLKQHDEEMQHLRDEVYKLRDQNSNSAFTLNGFKDKDDKVKFYTGLPTFNLLMVVFNFIAPHVAYSHRNSLSQFQEFILVLMRLRLNSPLQDLAYRFNVSIATASRIFEKWIDMMDIRLKHLIAWPERDILRYNMPYDFLRAFGDKVAVIIDCFEIFIDRPSSLIARAQTWSNYKHHNTVKFLIGVTPQGVISFISKGWGGRVSDKHLTENCSLLTNLLPGDIVLADRGFDISDSVGFYCAKLAIPAFTRGKKQLSALEVEETRKIANVRIHVERVIGAVRQKYQILGSTLALELVTCKEGQLDSPIDKIVRVCCSLTNLCPSVVSMN